MRSFRLFDMPEPTPEEKLRDMFTPMGWGIRGQKRADDNERTNKKLNDQPYYERKQNGKKKRY